MKLSNGLSRHPSRYTHRVAISNQRLIGFDTTGVTFRFMDHRRNGPACWVMTLATDEFIRRFLLHVLSRGLHRLRHHGLLASATRRIAHASELLAVSPPPERIEAVEPPDQRPPCPCFGGRMCILATFERWMRPRAPPQGSRAIGGAVVTRHGLNLHNVAAAVLRRSTRCHRSFTTVVADRS